MKRILIVEDEEALGLLYKEELATGAIVEHAYDKAGGPLRDTTLDGTTIPLAAAPNPNPQRFFNKILISVVLSGLICC